MRRLWNPIWYPGLGLALAGLLLAAGQFALNRSAGRSEETSRKIERSLSGPEHAQLRETLEQDQELYRSSRRLQFELTVSSVLLIFVVLFLLSREVSTRLKRERELRESTVLMEVVIEGSSDSVFVKDVDSRYLMINPAGATMIGRPMQDILGKSDCEILTPETAARLRESDLEIMRTGVSKLYEYSVALPGGTRVIESAKAPYRDHHGKVIGVIGIARDISAQKAAEAKLREAAQIKADFAAMVSHELRTPLTAIKLVIDMMLDFSLGPINDDQGKALSTAKRSIDRLSRLINETLDFQKLESGKMEFKLVSADINGIVDDVVKGFEPVAKDRGLTIESRLATGLPSVRCDPDKITQVMANFLSNALKFTRGPITVQTRRDKDGVRVSVADRGPGIAREDQSRLFQSFAQLPAGQTVHGGTGLGLAISKKIVERHNGHIGVESEEGAGATFYFTLPESAPA